MELFSKQEIKEEEHLSKFVWPFYRQWRGTALPDYATFCMITKYANQRRDTAFAIQSYLQDIAPLYHVYRANRLCLSNIQQGCRSWWRGSVLPVYVSFCGSLSSCGKYLDFTAWTVRSLNGLTWTGLSLYILHIKPTILYYQLSVKYTERQSTKGKKG